MKLILHARLSIDNTLYNPTAIEGAVIIRDVGWGAHIGYAHTMSKFYCSGDGIEACVGGLDICEKTPVLTKGHANERGR